MATEATVVKHSGLAWAGKIELLLKSSEKPLGVDPTEIIGYKFTLRALFGHAKGSCKRKFLSLDQLYLLVSDILFISPEQLGRIFANQKYK